MQFGIGVQEGLEALKNYVPAGMRQRINKKSGITFIEDCYNASPDSQAAALAVLAGLKAERTVAVIGDMLELGSVSKDAHYGVGTKAAENKIDAVFTYGSRSLETANGAKDGGIALVKSFDDKQALSAELVSFLKEGDAVLFKASRGMKLEDVIYSVYDAFEKN
jgi:UDP-N-acetylmuramoyl-tripeptide--D-alanyl-D-alanine ligase